MTLVKDIKSLLDNKGLLAIDAEGEASSHELLLAVAVIVVRAAYTDARFAPEEREETLNDLSKLFGMEERDVEVLIKEARSQQGFDSWIASYLERIHDDFDVDQRIEVLALVWRIVEADGLIDSREDAFLDSLQLSLGLSSAEADEAQRRTSV